MTIYDVLEKRHEMPRAYEDWADYRKKWTDMILRHISFEEESLLIIGAGACNDYDLPRLLEHFRQIHLMDSDIQSMNQALQRLPKEQLGRIMTYEGDLLKITPSEYQEFCQEMQAIINHRGKLTEIKELADIAIHFVDNLYRNASKRRSSEFPVQASYVAIAGVHSQINHMLPWIWEAYMKVLDQREETIFNRISEENDKLQKQLNENLFRAAKYGVFVASEKSRVGTPGQIQGSYQALMDLDERVKAGECTLVEEQTLPWPYDLRQQIIYEMRCMYLKKN